MARATSTSTVTISDYSGTTKTKVFTYTGTSLQDNGGFTISTRTSNSKSSSTYTMRPRSGTTSTITTTLTSYTLVSYNGTRVPEPSCELPSIFPQCQSQMGRVCHIRAYTFANTPITLRRLPGQNLSTDVGNHTRVRFAIQQRLEILPRAALERHEASLHTSFDWRRSLRYRQRCLRAPAEFEFLTRCELRSIFFEWVSWQFPKHHGTGLQDSLVVANVLDAWCAFTHIRVWTVSWSPTLDQNFETYIDFQTGVPSPAELSSSYIGHERRKRRVMQTIRVL